MPKRPAEDISREREFQFQTISIPSAKTDVYTLSDVNSFSYLATFLDEFSPEFVTFVMQSAGCPSLATQMEWLKGALDDKHAQYVQARRDFKESEDDSMAEAQAFLLMTNSKLVGDKLASVFVMHRTFLEETVDGQPITQEESETLVSAFSSQLSQIGPWYWSRSFFQNAVRAVRQRNPEIFRFTEAKDYYTKEEAGRSLLSFARFFVAYFETTPNFANRILGNCFGAHYAWLKNRLVLQRERAMRDQQKLENEGRDEVSPFFRIGEPYAKLYVFHRKLLNPIIDGIPITDAEVQSLVAELSTAHLTYQFAFRYDSPEYFQNAVRALREGRPVSEAVNYVLLGGKKNHDQIRRNKSFH